MTLTKQALDEMMELASSEAFKRDMEAISRRVISPFIKDGVIDVDKYIDFVTTFNEFINHQLKPFKPMIEKEMKL